MPWVSSAAYSALLTKAARADALAAENERLRENVERERSERIDVTNRLLEKSQIRPLSEPMPAARSNAPVFPVISPFGALDNETEDLAREAWVADLAQGYVEEKDVDIQTARTMALGEYTRRFQPLN